MAADKQRGKLYPHNRSRLLDEKIFQRPGSEYRAAPFCSWNTRLDVPQLLRQIDQFHEMGFGGFHMHSRTGLATPYLGKDFMSAVIACTRHAARRKMLACLYDEDRWPSGFAGGLVTQDPVYRARQLLWTRTPLRTDEELIGRYTLTLRDGRLQAYRRLKDTEVGAADQQVWLAYLQPVACSSWFNHQADVDTMNRAAIERFIQVTHERYARAVGMYFGTTVPAIFTDEPRFVKKTMFGRTAEGNDLVMPFTGDFLHTFYSAYNQRLEDSLPELFWDLPDGKPSLTRYRYHDHTAERFASAFGDTLGRWCGRHGIALTGHMLAEVNLSGQTRGCGEVMRAMRSFQLPGIDILCDRIEFTTAKQAQSLVHQYGREGMTSELYGVTNWSFDFAGHKRQGDWQAALGVTVRVPHLAWVSMAGEAKRDYPAAIGYQSPWYREYPLVEDHFARLNAVLTRGRPLVRVGMVHPIESSWLNWGPSETNAEPLQERERTFAEMTAWLVHGLVDFNYLCEALLPELCPLGKAGAPLRVGKMRYDAIVVPPMRTIRGSTLDRLEAFATAGGLLIFAGEIPSLVEARPSGRPARLARRAVTCAFSKPAVLGALAGVREIDIQLANGARADTLVHQARSDGSRRHVFICNLDLNRGRNNTRIRLRGRWHVVRRDTHSGGSQTLTSSIAGGWTHLSWDFPAHGHLLLTLGPATAAHRTTRPPAAARTWEECGRLEAPHSISLSEPNVLLLDQAQWRLDDGDWQALEEMLRIDDQVRHRLNLPPRGGRMAQPWVDQTPAPAVARLQLRLRIQAEVKVARPKLALENAQSTRITLDSRPVHAPIEGWWVDESIQTVPLPAMEKGEHTLLLDIPFGRKTDVEWCYLLGDFGVRIAGRQAILTPAVRTLAWGDWTHQGLPFYAGNVTYHCTVRGEGGEMSIQAAQFRNPLLRVRVDGREREPIAFAPYQCSLGRVRGEHALDLTAFGNRHNAFGPLHHTDERLSWVGPAAWRSKGTAWAYECRLRPTGVLSAPILWRVRPGKGA